MRSTSNLQLPTLSPFQLSLFQYVASIVIVFICFLYLPFTMKTFQKTLVWEEAEREVVTDDDRKQLSVAILAQVGWPNLLTYSYRRRRTCLQDAA